MGPLQGLKVVEFAGLGPGPFCAMLLSDLGAEVIRIDRAGSVASNKADMRDAVMLRGRRSIAIDLKNPRGVDTAMRLVSRADALIEGFRPGVMERLGLGPDACLQANPRLVYGRMTGWGQEGPLSQFAGHDLNYMAVTGALHAMGPSDRPPSPPLNLVADFGGGALYLAMGILAGCWEARQSGRGQVVDCAIVDGTASLLAGVFGWLSNGRWKDERESNHIDGAAHFYGCYATLDSEYVSVAPIEPQFYGLFLNKLGLQDADLPQQWDQQGWASMRRRLAEIFRSRTRDEWTQVFSGTDACVAPVLSLLEASRHPYNTERKVFIEVAGVPQPAPAPRFSRTRASVQHPPARPGQCTVDVLKAFGFASEDIADLLQAGAVVQDGVTIA